METGRRFDPTKYLRTIKTRSGKQETYLPVPARLLWLRSDHPNASVLTEALKLDDRNAIFKATITLPGGAVAVGHGSEAAGDFGDYIEKAETKAIGRALAALGYGMESAEILDDSTIAATTATDMLPVVVPAPAPAPIAVVLPSSAVATAPVTAPVSIPQPMQPPPPSSLAPLQEATMNRPERGERYERPEPRIERNDRNDRNDRTERPDRPERFDRNDRNDRNDRTNRPEPRTERNDRPEPPERTDRYAPPPRSLMDRVPRPERPERTEPIEELSPPLPRPGMMERPVRPERVSRSRDLMPSSSPGTSAEPEPIEEMPPAPTPIRRTGRTLVARATGAPGASSLPALPANVPSTLPEPSRMMGTPEPEDTGDAGEPDDELEPATISTTSFWRWAKSKGYPDRRAVEAATGRGMDTMTPREAYFRLREVIARGTAP